MHNHMPFKSPLAAIVLSLLLGPLGALYASWKLSIGLVVLALIVSIIGNAIGHSLTFLVVLIWLSSIYISVICVERYNQRLLNQYSKGDE